MPKSVSPTPEAEWAVAWETLPWDGWSSERPLSRVQRALVHAMLKQGGATTRVTIFPSQPVC